jgi:hypothetical protein
VSLAERFLVPPFSVLDARQGYWQARKRAWIALGIQSELGRGDNIGAIPANEAALPERRFSTENGLLGESQQARSHYRASPGGTLRPATSLGKDGKTQRGDGAGKPLARTEGSGSPGELAAAYKAQGRLTALQKTGDSRQTASLRGGLLFGTTLHPYDGASPSGDRMGNPRVNSVFGPPEDAGTAASQSGTSIFDPVLCELAYRWFCPPGGTILDPFAGGSVRGIVAARLGRAYTGIDLRPEQLAANDAQWTQIGGGPAGAPALLAPPRVESCGDLRIVRDDEVPGGSKVRALLRVLPTFPAEELVYASPAAGFAQIALALAAQMTGKRATIFVAHRKTLHPCTAAARQAGARIEEVPAGYLSNVQAKARAYCATTGAELVPFGLDAPPYLEALAQMARETGEHPNEVWCVAGSGVLARALRQAWPTAHLCVVVIGKAPTLPEDNIHVYQAPEAFEQDARQPPPFASCGHYDAKAWQFVTQHATPGALFWNVAGEAPLDAAPSRVCAPRWLVGDSQALDTLPLDPAYDFVFTCPPYADLEQYSDDPRDLSVMDFPAFLGAYRTILAQALARLKADRFACVVVGDVRAPDGSYRNLVSETIAAGQAAGATLYNEAILVTAVGSLPLRAGIPFVATRKLGKTHQNVLVFVKGDARRATEACGPVEVTQALEAVMPIGESSGALDTAYNTPAGALE